MDRDYRKPEVRRIGFKWIFSQKSSHLLHVSFGKLFSSSYLLLVTIFVVGAIKEFVAFYIGLIPSLYYKVLPAKDQQAFVSTTIFAFVYVVSMASILSLLAYLNYLISLVLRKNLTNYLHDLYFKDRNIYEVNNFSTLDNVDQRFTQDIEKMTRNLADVYFTLISSPFLIGFYSYKTYERAGWLGPVSAAVFFVVATLLDIFSLKWVSKSVFSLERSEGFFRFKHTNLRTYSEEIAFLSCSKLENENTKDVFHTLLIRQFVVAYRRTVLKLLTSMCDYIGAILTYLAVGLAVFGGMYSESNSIEITTIISETSFFLLYLINKYTTLISSSNIGAELVGISHRVHALLDTLEQVSSKSPNNGKQLKDQEQVQLDKFLPDQTLVKCQNLNYFYPYSPYDPIVKDISLTVERGYNVLITGPSGCGKTSFLRSLCSIWPSVQQGFKLNSGDIDWDSGMNGDIFNPSRTMWLPQRPYFTNGTLIDQILLPKSTKELINPGSYSLDLQLSSFLDIFGLGALKEQVGGLNGDYKNDWNITLSQGEQQRLSLLRVCYHCPEIAFLDEPTSQIAKDSEALIYKLLISRGITLVTVGHRDSLRHFHQVELRFDGSGGWKIKDIEKGDVV